MSSDYLDPEYVTGKTFRLLCQKVDMVGAWERGPSLSLWRALHGPDSRVYWHPISYFLGSREFPITERDGIDPHLRDASNCG